MKQFVKVFLLATLLLLVMIYGDVRTGFLDVSHWDLLMALLGLGDPALEMTVLDFRLVRIILALLIGVGLGLAGAVFQTISRNDLASPSILGVNAGAGLGVILLVYFLNSDTALSMWALALVALLGGLATAGLIYRLAYHKGQVLNPQALILTGIAVAAGIHAIQMLLIVRLDPNKFHVVNTWIIGSIANNSWGHVALLAPVVIILGLLLWARYMDLNILNLADETAIGLGLSINQARFVYLLLAVILATMCVAVGGNIAFVGLIAPHIARHLVGTDHVYSLPITALAGAILLVGADWFGRSVLAPDEILIGIVVAMIGAPYFLYILAKTKA
jgi:ferrichrome transport system permease protein fhuG